MRVDVSPIGIRAVAVILWVVAACGVFAAEAPLGFRGAGAGGPLDDCDPPVRWQEYRTSYTTENGSRVKPETTDEPAPANICWKTDLNVYGLGTPLLVGGKLFLVAERWSGIQHVGQPALGMFAEDPVLDEAVGPVLYCLDPATGKVLWHRDLNHLDRIPPDKVEAVRKAARESRDCHRLYARLTVALLTLVRKAATAAITDADRAAWTADRATLVREFPKHNLLAGKDTPGGLPIPAELGDVPEWIKGKSRDVMWAQLAAGKDVNMNAGVILLGFGTHHSSLNDAEKARFDLLRRYGYYIPTWSYDYSYIGTAMPTPCSDGRYVYVSTGHGDAFCYDTDGNRRWSWWHGREARGSVHKIVHTPSPVLCGDVLLVFASTESMNADARYYGLDTRDGRQLYEVTGIRSHYYGASGTPVAMRLPLPGAGEHRTLDLFVTPGGEFIRCRDGKILADRQFHQSMASAPQVIDDVIVVCNRSGAGHTSAGAESDGLPAKDSLCALRYAALSEDTIERTVLWAGNFQHAAKLNILVQDGHVFAPSARALNIIDYRTGTRLSGGQSYAALPKALAEAWKTKPGAIFPWSPSLHQHYQYGKYLYECEGGTTTVWDVSDLTKPPVPVSMNVLGQRGITRWPETTPMLFSGNRIFVRSASAVYCIGDTLQPMRLSTVHQ